MCQFFVKVNETVEILCALQLCPLHEQSCTYLFAYVHTVCIVCICMSLSASQTLPRLSRAHGRHGSGVIFTYDADKGQQIKAPQLSLFLKTIIIQGNSFWGADACISS